MVAKHVNKKNAGKPRVLAINALLHSLVALAATRQCNSFLLLTLIIMQRHRESEFCANLMYHESDPGQAGYPTLKRLHGKIWPRLRGLPGLADRATHLGGSPHLSCKRDQFKKRDYMDRWVTPHKRATSPSWGLPSPCKQALISPIQTTWYSPRNLPFVVSLIMHAYTRGCTCIRRHLKEIVLWGTITWSERENKAYKLKRAIGKVVL